MKEQDHTTSNNKMGKDKHKDGETAATSETTGAAGETTAETRKQGMPP